jgi:peroxiredoxin
VQSHPEGGIMPRKIIIQLFFLILCRICYAQVSVGDPAINFNLPDTNNVYHTLQEFSGDILLINFFASWCIPCQEEAPLLEDSIWQVYGNQGVTVLGISKSVTL